MCANSSIPGLVVVVLPMLAGCKLAADSVDVNRAVFRFDGELATLVLGRDRRADCVSNPVAAGWQEAPRRGAR